MAKHNFGRELWDKMVDFARQPDELPVYECGEWTLDKLYFLANYLAQVTQVMVGKPQFETVNYIDLFASSGICVLRGTGREPRRYPGSAILAAGCARPFSNLYLVEEKPELLNALTERLKRLSPQSRVIPFLGDANEVVSELADKIPPKSLNIAFVDPYSLDVHFSTILKLAKYRPMDLLILFADDTDLLRNVQDYYYPRRDGKLDLFLGSESDWRTEWDRLAVREAPQVRQLFSDLYLRQLKTIGYDHSDTQPILRDGRPLYRLVYASKNKLGLKFWRIAQSEGRLGDKSLFRIE